MVLVLDCHMGDRGFQANKLAVITQKEEKV